MARKWYGSLNNRVDENRMFCDEIKVGTGMTKYSWSDRHAYEVIGVKDQKHVTVREYDHRKIGEQVLGNNHWELISNPENPTYDLCKRGKYWYVAVTITPQEAKEILEGNDVDAKIWACHNDFNLPEIIESGKNKTRYHKWNVSFGVAEYYYDYEF